MTFQRVKQGCGVLVWLLFGAGGCSAPDAADDAALPELETGQLSLPLVTANQDTFRLSQALFQIETIAGGHVLTLDSDLDPEAEQLEAELTQGTYRSRLDSGWLLERVVDDGSFESVSAALLTPNPVQFEIRSGRTTQLEYTFSTDQGSVTLGEGQVLVSIDVTSSPIPSNCNPLSNFECPSGQTCLLAGDSGATYCASPGTLPVGAECSSEQCVAGAQCLSLDPDDPTRRTCTRFCNVFSSEFGCTCLSIGDSDSSLGVCGPLPAGACDLLAQTGCGADQACQFETGTFGTCGAFGERGQFESCAADRDCAPGFDCISRFFGERQCLAFCDITQGQFESCAEFGGFCSFVGTGNTGRCD